MYKLSAIAISKEAFHLLQLSDSSLPTGGFAYSHGIETLIHANKITDLDTLRKALITQVVSIGQTELIGLWTTACADDPQVIFPHVCRYLTTFLWAEETRQASSLLGRRLLTIAERFSNQVIYKSKVEEANYILNGPVAGLVCRSLEFTPLQMAQSFLFTHITQSASAATRLLGFDSLAVNEIVWHLSDLMQEVVEVSSKKVLKEISPMSFELEIAQMRHKYEYLRLFRN